MRIGFSFFGILHGPGGRTGSDRDFRHCWPNLNNNLVRPFLEQGHDCKIMFSGYTIKDPLIERELHSIVKPENINYSHFANSDPFTAKFAAFNNFINDHELDAVVFTRSDIHFKRIMANENIDWEKINFLFPEKGWWESHKFSCDNFYVIPKKYFRAVRDAMEDTYCYPRGKPYVDTHGLWNKLETYVDPENFHFISNEAEISDVNSFYTCCRNGLPIGEERMVHLHTEVKEKFYQWV